MIKTEKNNEDEDSNSDRKENNVLNFAVKIAILTTATTVVKAAMQNLFVES